ncbi:S1C family serine protease [Consotaella salsifontis]|uniref:S1C family serine protease n=1 Tax=Consotaella salsifontis TaxID=1365950 RepID=UPI0013F60E73|nr:serine protease [Consotaella salsifontis]
MVLASRTNLDEAVGIASVYEWRFDQVRVVRSSNGWLAVIAGPVPIPEGARAAKQKLLANGGVPADLFLSNGSEFKEIVWKPEKIKLPSWSTGSSRAVNFDSNGLSVTIDSVQNDAESRSPRITAFENGRRAFSSVLTDVSTGDGASTVRIAPLDPTSDRTDIVFSAFWGGAHCCTVTQIFSRQHGKWTQVQASVLDGDGYTFSDLDQDGSLELVSADNSFLYAFAPYALSWAPMVVEQLRGGKILDQRHSGQFVTSYRRDLYRMEHAASLDKSLWSSNGFLAAWVATKALLGEFDDAWRRMEASYDKNSDWTMQVCSQALKLADCPESFKVNASFPEALKAHLQEHGYLSPSTPQTPQASQPAPAQVASQAPSTVDTPVPEPAVSDKDNYEQATSSGTGFFVSESGEILTNFHVVNECRRPVVLQGRSVPLPATIVALDETNDLALMKVEKQGGQFAKFNVKVRLGEAVAAYGYPLSSILSSGGNFTLGNVTAQTGLRDDSRYLQMSAPVQPGNSGGPLLDSHGNVAGIVTAKLNAFAAMLATGDIAQNVNFAIRSATAVSFLLANGIEVTFANDAASSPKLDAPDLADFAKEISVAIRCH